MAHCPALKEVSFEGLGALASVGSNWMAQSPSDAHQGVPWGRKAPTDSGEVLDGPMFSSPGGNQGHPALEAVRLAAVGSEAPDPCRGFIRPVKGPERELEEVQVSAQTRREEHVVSGDNLVSFQVVIVEPLGSHRDCPHKGVQALS